MTVNIATTEQIYNEFSSGKQDLIAIRSYLRWLYDKAETEDDMPDNVLLFGDASFDYKGIGVAITVIQIKILYLHFSQNILLS